MGMAPARALHRAVLTQRMLPSGYGQTLSRARGTTMPLAPRNPIQETGLSVQVVPGMRFLVFEFAVYCPRDVRSCTASAALGRSRDAAQSVGGLESEVE
eukprot:3899211-Rhodomonas_salina.2